MKNFFKLALAGSLFFLSQMALMSANEVLVPAGAVWSYLDNGSDQGTAWRAPGFDDVGWGVGAAELGYGDGDEATLVGFGGSTTSRFITTYFRKTFTVAAPSDFQALKIRLLRDDGAVVYLNGAEIRRDNLPTGTIGYKTTASTALGAPAESTFYDSVHAASLLVQGVNTLAVEVHQSGGSSSDVSFNLELLGVGEAGLTRGPYLQLGTPTSVVIRWRTDVAAVGKVRYGPADQGFIGEVDGAAATTEHAIELSGLLPGTTYLYSVGTMQKVLSGGADHSFTTAPPVGTVQPTRVWVLGDSGTKNASAAAVRNAYSNYPGSAETDVWLMLGDNAYDNGTDAEYQAAVFDMYPSFLRRSVLWSTIGNHDSGQSTSTTATFPYLDIFTLPTKGEAGGVASGTEKYYSFDYANIHFICLDSMTTSRSTTGAMAQWLQMDLENTNQEWIIAFWHHPPYTKGSHDSDTESQLVQMRQNFLPMLEAGGVDLVLAGHSHSYERSYLINGHYGLSGTLTSSMKLDGGNGREDGTGVYEKPGANAAGQGAVYITAGSSGKISGGLLNHPAMCVSLNQLGSLVLDVDGSRLDARFLRETGVTTDYFTITKSVANQPPTVALTSPEDGDEFASTAAIELTASASDPDGQVVSVHFYSGDTLIGSAAAEPFQMTWGNASTGTHVLTASAIDALGSTVTSSPVTIEVLPAPPPAPQGLTALSGVGRIDLAWGASATATGYRVYRAFSSAGPWVDVSSALTATGYTDTAVTAGTLYFYQVTAFNAGGEGGFSNQVSATPTAPLTVPAAPTNLQAVAVSKAQINLAWTDASENETAFLVERRQGTGKWSQIASVPANAVSYSSVGLAAGKSYSYRIRSTNSAGSSAYSNIATATTLRR